MSPRKPHSPTDLRPRRWWRVLERTIAEAREDDLTDWAAALTYYGVLALFPAFIALVALLGLVGQHPETTNALLDIVEQVGSEQAAEAFRGPIEGVIQAKGGAGALLGVGLFGALWSASGYVSAFGRAGNRIWEVREGRPFWKLRPLQILVTLVVVILVAAAALLLVVSGPVLEAVGDAIGLGEAGLWAWRIVKWPVLLVIALGVVTLLYYTTPNVRPPKLRWITPGSAFAVLVWIVASAGFAVYVTFSGSYNATYGSLGGVIVLLVWMWISNLALLVGAQFDAELERERELAGGQPAEEELQLPERDPSR